MLYDSPVLLERATHLFEAMHRGLHPGRRLKLDTFPLSVLDHGALSRYIAHSFDRAGTIVIAANASWGLSLAATRHLEYYLNPDGGVDRALVAFIQGRSPAARETGRVLDQLQIIASRHGVNFLAHVADPAPYPAWPRLDFVPQSAFRQA